jgi:hypothetical protein
MIEVTNRRFRERLAERRHPVLPLLFPNHPQSLDVGEMLNAELEVFPRCTGIPTVETSHVKQHAQLAVLQDKSLELRHKVRVIRLGQLPADMNSEHLPAVFFIELNGRLGLLSFVSNWHHARVFATKEARIPVRKIPSKVPAPPIEATGAPKV